MDAYQQQAAQYYQQGYPSHPEQYHQGYPSPLPSGHATPPHDPNHAATANGLNQWQQHAQHYDPQQFHCPDNAAIQQAHQLQQYQQYQHPQQAQPPAAVPPTTNGTRRPLPTPRGRPESMPPLPRHSNSIPTSFPQHSRSKSISPAPPIAPQLPQQPAIQAPIVQQARPWSSFTPNDQSYAQAQNPPSSGRPPLPQSQSQVTPTVPSSNSYPLPNSSRSPYRPAARSASTFSPGTDLSRVATTSSVRSLDSSTPSSSTAVTSAFKRALPPAPSGSTAPPRIPVGAGATPIPSSSRNPQINTNLPTQSAPTSPTQSSPTNVFRSNEAAISMGINALNAVKAGAGQRALPSPLPSTIVNPTPNPTPKPASDPAGIGAAAMQAVKSQPGKRALPTWPPGSGPVPPASIPPATDQFSSQDSAPMMPKVDAPSLDNIDSEGSYFPAPRDLRSRPARSAAQSSSAWASRALPPSPSQQPKSPPPATTQGPPVSKVQPPAAFKQPLPSVSQSQADTRSTASRQLPSISQQPAPAPMRTVPADTRSSAASIQQTPSSYQPPVPTITSSDGQSPATSSRELPSSYQPPIPVSAATTSSSARSPTSSTRQLPSVNQAPITPARTPVETRPSARSSPFSRALPSSSSSAPRPQSTAFELPNQKKDSTSSSIKDPVQKTNPSAQPPPARTPTSQPRSPRKAAPAIDLDDLPPQPILRTITPTPPSPKARPKQPSPTMPSISLPPSVPTFSFPDGDTFDDDDFSVGSQIVVSSAAPQISVSAAPSLNAPSVNVTPAAGSRPATVINVKLDGPESRAEDSRAKKLSGLPPPIKKGGLRCGGCEGAIVGRIVSAMDVRWHPKCFKCTICKELLEHVSSFEHNGRPYCHLDYHDLFAPECYHCRTPIADEQYITLDDPALGGLRTYHESHFFCAECGDPFLQPSHHKKTRRNPDGSVEVVEQDDDVGFTVYRGHPYCEACHVRLRMPKCKKCKRSMRPGEDAIEALGGKWCWTCFVCGRCEQPFQDPAFFQRGSVPFCEPCYKVILVNELE